VVGAPREIVYTVDAEDRIRDLDGDWTRAGEPPLGQPLWRYVRGEGLAALYRELFAKVREGRHLQLTYRCDSPTHRQSYRMSLRPVDGGVQTHHLLVRAEARDEPLVVLGASRGQSLLTRCSVCNDFGRGREWRDLVTSVEADDFLDDDRPVRVVHGICPTCKGSIASL